MVDRMAGPIGFGVGAARGVRRVTCPHCGAVMARSAKVTGRVTCKTCKRSFEVAPPPRTKKR